MTVLLAEYKVRDYDAFKTVFDEFMPTRVESGSTGHRLLRSLDDPSLVTVVFGFSTVDDARRFADDPRRAEALARAGVVERADEVLEEVELLVY